jgi:hypothetical protein
MPGRQRTVKAFGDQDQAIAYAKSSKAPGGIILHTKDGNFLFSRHSKKRHLVDREIGL